MTQSEFIKMYCDNSKITEEKLNELGQYAVKCDCSEEDCCGWAMVSNKTIEDHINLYQKAFDKLTGDPISKLDKLIQK